MRRTDVLLCTRREANSRDSETVQLAQRAGLIRQFGSGLYAFTPSGERVRQHVIRIVTTELNRIGGQAVDLPQLQYRPIWEQSGRWGNFEDEMFTFENRDGQQMCLAPSHEEGIVHLVDGIVRSYEDLPVLLYQVGKKHRDDHPRNGLLRTKEFTMKDAYSLHASDESLDTWYERVRSAYVRIFDRLGIEFVVADADNSVMGGANSEEFIALADSGTVDVRWCTGDECLFGSTDESKEQDIAAFDSCPDCGAQLTAGEGIEIGHVFKLGTRYSDSIGLHVDTADETTTAVRMGSYGIGIDRLIHTLIEQHADESGCRWPASETARIAPFEVSIIPLDYEGDLKDTADELHRTLDSGSVLLFDDATQTIGERFAESDLLGIPQKVVLGNHFRETNEVEIETRDGETRFVDVGSVTERLRT
ncbi:aminoacyl--tRNA ligase-related protein [Haloferax namakaokahaiae]|uniref:proline--tRNA ligase n=1 Tax=Haloferax namakaokahaiae TaxID=1748331 RepID=A0ABD5ZCP2_9EURY